MEEAGWLGQFRRDSDWGKIPDITISIGAWTVPLRAQGKLLRCRAMMWSSRTSHPAPQTTEIVDGRSHARHCGDPPLVELRHEVLTHLGMDHSS